MEAIFIRYIFICMPFTVLYMLSTEYTAQKVLLLINLLNTMFLLFHRINLKDHENAIAIWLGITALHADTIMPTYLNLIYRIPLLTLQAFFIVAMIGCALYYIRKFTDEIRSILISLKVRDTSAYKFLTATD